MFAKAKSNIVSKEGFVFSKGQGIMKPATLYIYPTGLAAVLWLDVWFKAKIGDGTEYELEENKYVYTHFYTTEA